MRSRARPVEWNCHRRLDDGFGYPHLASPRPWAPVSMPTPKPIPRSWNFRVLDARGSGSFAQSDRTGRMVALAAREFEPTELPEALAVVEHGDDDDDDYDPSRRLNRPPERMFGGSWFAGRDETLPPRGSRSCCRYCRCRRHGPFGRVPRLLLCHPFLPAAGTAAAGPSNPPAADSRGRWSLPEVVPDHPPRRSGPVVVAAAAPGASTSSIPAGPGGAGARAGTGFCRPHRPGSPACAGARPGGPSPRPRARSSIRSTGPAPRGAFRPGGRRRRRRPRSTTHREVAVAAVVAASFAVDRDCRMNYHYYSDSGLFPYLYSADTIDPEQAAAVLAAAVALWECVIVVLAEIVAVGPD